MDDVAELVPLNHGEGDEGTTQGPGLPRSGKVTAEKCEVPDPATALPLAPNVSRRRVRVDPGEVGGDGLV